MNDIRLNEKQSLEFKLAAKFTTPGENRSRTATYYAQLAQAAGCTAKTLNGVLRYFRKHRHRLLPLRSLGPTYRSHPVRYAARLSRIIDGREKCPKNAAALKKDATRLIREKALSSRLTATWPYWRSSSRWAGGEHRVLVSLSASNLTDSTITTERVWSSNGKWSGTNSVARIIIDEKVPDKLILVGGLVTVWARRVRGSKAYKAVWLQQKAHAAKSALIQVEGWIVRDYHSTAPTVDLAVHEEHQARRKRHMAAVQAGAARRLTDFNEEKILKEVTKSFIAWDDSIACGNCVAGTRQAAIRVAASLGLDPTELQAGVAVRGDIVLKALPEHRAMILKILAVKSRDPARM